jgi:hypothetical protein
MSHEKRPYNLETNVVYSQFYLQQKQREKLYKKRLEMSKNVVQSGSKVEGVSGSYDDSQW